MPDNVAQIKSQMPNIDFYHQYVTLDNKIELFCSLKDDEYKKAVKLGFEIESMGAAT